MIKDVLLCGLGGVGSVYASLITDSKMFNLKILLDKKRLERYTQNPTIINDKAYNFKYITPNEDFSPQLIIIATKFTALKDVLKEIKPFTKNNPIILSFMNGITSEDIIKKNYPNCNVIKSHEICDSIIRNNREITHSKRNKLTFGSENNIIKKELETFFENTNIKFEVSENIEQDLWQKFMLNITANQLSAVTIMTFGQMQNIKNIETLLNNILKEVIEIAQKENINNPEKIAQQAINSFMHLAPYGKTSMLQDIENTRPTELEAFAGTIIKLGKQHNIKTPYNNLFMYLL